MRGQIDLVLAAGDITIAGHEAYAGQFLECVRGHDVPLLLVHGNNDTREVVELFRREEVTIHRRARELLGHRFVGFGGDGNAPHDVELAEGEQEHLPLDGAIFLTHIPPASRGPAPQGGPRAHICGHIHHTEGTYDRGTTRIVKLRAAMWNRCALLDLETRAVTFLNLEP